MMKRKEALPPLVSSARLLVERDRDLIRQLELELFEAIREPPTHSALPHLLYRLPDGEFTACMRTARQRWLHEARRAVKA